MSWLSNLMNPGGGYKNAQQESEKYFNQAQGALQPYNQFGQGAGNTLQDLIKQYMNPQELYNKWAQGYETSPYAQNMLQQNQGAGMDAASQMGLLGSSSALSNIQQGAGNIMEKDRNDYLQKLMEMMNQGGNFAGNMYGVGAGAAGQMGQNAMNQGNNMAGLKYGEYNAGPDFLKDILGGGAKFGADWLTGGYGGAPGASYGRGMFKPTKPT